MVRVGDSCIDPTPLTPEQEAISAAKTSAANAYDAELRGTGSQESTTAADKVVAELTGAPVPPPERNKIARENGTDPGYSPLGSVTGYWPLRQVNSYYCGPASIDSMLWYFGDIVNSQYLTSATYDTVTGAYDQITGTDATDQTLLANFFWLATDYYGGTNWGTQYMPFTLNGWRGDSWYIQAAGPYLGGALTQSQYLVDVQYDVDRGYPLTQNVRYNSSSFIPDGFAPGDYEHWDTVYGHFYSGAQYVQVGQVYASPNYTFYPYQNIELSRQWNAIAIHHGIVW